MNQNMKENTKHRVRLSKVLLNLILSAAIVFGSMPCKPFVMEVKANTPAEKTITGLGLGTIMTKPNEPQYIYEGWSGSHVYFGKYAGKPMKYRVLACSENMILLDCDNILKDIKFSTNNSNSWKESEVRSWLQGNEFYNNISVFTAAEKNAIHAGNEEIEGIDDGIIPEGYTIAALENPDPVFVLNVSAVTNSRLGYYNDTDYSNTRQKKLFDGTDSKPVDWWWLRSKGKDQIDHYNSVGTVYGDRVRALSVIDEWVGVSPALYLDAAPILYSSLVDGSEGQAGSEYKLTVKDEGLSVSYNNVEGEDDRISVSYTITDNSSAEPTQISVVVTDKAWDSETKLNEINVIQYTKLAMDSFGSSGTGTFTLDPNLTGTFGQDYHVYILAEDVNGTCETDYASEPVELELKSSVQASAEDVEVTYDGKPHGISVNIAGDTEGVTVKYGSRADDCTKKLGDLAITDVNDSPREIFYKASKQGYFSASGSATVKINKAPLTVKAKDKTITYGDAPANGGVEYSGFVNSETESVLGGTLSYDYSYTQGNNIGSYTITPKGLTSDNYSITFETGILTVAKADIEPSSVTAPTANTGLIYTGSAQELIKAGSVADNTGILYYAVTTENTAPSDNSVYTTSIPTATDAGTYYVWYKVDADGNHIDTKPQCIKVRIQGVISRAVTFKVVNGYWNEGEGEEAGADRIVILKGVEGEELKLSANQIPAAGSRPTDDTYKSGSWDRIPGTENEITEDTTYTYTYVMKDKSAFIDEPAAYDLTYDGDEHYLITGGTVSAGSILYSSDGSSYGEDIPKAKDAGQYTVYCKVTGDEDHIESDVKEIPVTIRRKKLTIVADAKTKVCGEDDPELTYTYDGLVEGDEIEGELFREEGEEAGTYAIQQGSLTAGGNYNIEYTGAELTIEKNDVEPGPETKPEDINIQKAEELSKLLLTKDSGNISGIYQNRSDTVSCDIAVASGKITSITLDKDSVKEGKNYLTFNTGTRIVLGEEYTVSNNFAKISDYKKARKFVKKKKNGYELDLKALKSAKGKSYELILTSGSKELIIDVVDVSLNKKELSKTVLSTQVTPEAVIANAVSENNIGTAGFVNKDGVLTISTMPGVKAGIAGRESLSARFATGVWNVAGRNVGTGEIQTITKGKVKVYARVNADGTLSLAKADGSGKGSVAITYTLNGQAKLARDGIKYKSKVYKAKVKVQ